MGTFRWIHTGSCKKKKITTENLEFWKRKKKFEDKDVAGDGGDSGGSGACGVNSGGDNDCTQLLVWAY